MKCVLIIHQSDGKVVKKMGPMEESKANKVAAGAEINLNHDEYFVRIVQAKRGEGNGNG